MSIPAEIGKSLFISTALIRSSLGYLNAWFVYIRDPVFSLYRLVMKLPSEGYFKRSLEKEPNERHVTD